MYASPLCFLPSSAAHLQLIFLLLYPRRVAVARSLVPKQKASAVSMVSPWEFWMRLQQRRVQISETSAAKHRYLSEGCYTGKSDRLIPGQTWGRHASLPESDSPVGVSDFTSDHAVLWVTIPQVQLDTVKYTDLKHSVGGCCVVLRCILFIHVLERLWIYMCVWVQGPVHEQVRSRCLSAPDRDGVTQVCQIPGL